MVGRRSFPIGKVTFPRRAVKLRGGIHMETHPLITILKLDTHRDTELSVAPVASLPVLRRWDYRKCLVFRILRKCESRSSFLIEVTPFWKKSLTWSEKNTSLNCEHPAGLDESSLINRVYILWTLPFSIHQTWITIATWTFSGYLQFLQLFYIYIYI